MAGSTQAKLIQKVYSDWCVQASEIILESRMGDSAHAKRTTPQIPLNFKLNVNETFGVRAEAIGNPDFFQRKTQRSFHLEIYLLRDDGSATYSVPSAASPPFAPAIAASEAVAFGQEFDAGQLLERWTFTFFPPAVVDVLSVSPGSWDCGLDPCNDILMQKLSVSLRALASYTHTLPAYNICRSAHVQGRRRWRVREGESWPPPPPSVASIQATSAAQEMVTQDFTSAHSSFGTLRLSVAHCKDLKALAAAAGGAGSTARTAFGSQLDLINVEEGYFGSENVLVGDTLAGLRWPSDEIKENAGGRVADELVPTKASAGSDVANPVGRVSHGSPGGGLPRPRGPSYDSVGGSSSRSGMSSGKIPDHVVSLASTPPLAHAGFGRSLPQGLITLGPQWGDSLPSTRSPSPQMSPQREVGLIVTMSAESGSTDIAGVNVGASSDAGCGGSSGKGQVFDDLSDIWARNSIDIGRRPSCGSRRSGASSPSRSYSPCPDAYNFCGAGSLDGGEIFMLGMDDDEEEKKQQKDVCFLKSDAEEADTDEEDLAKNVVVLALEAGGACDGGAFAGAYIGSTFPGAGVCTDATLEEALSRLGGLEAEFSSKPSRSSSAGGRQSPLLKASPLIAGLNPFSTSHMMPALELPPSAGDDTAECVKRADSSDAIDDPSTAVSGEKPVDRLLVEMGDLVCKLQQRRLELCITGQEVTSAQLLEKLAYFRRVDPVGESGDDG